MYTRNYRKACGSCSIVLVFEKRFKRGLFRTVLVSQLVGVVGERKYRQIFIFEWNILLFMLGWKTEVECDSENESFCCF